MKGQPQLISIMIIVGIILALIGATYFWGKPLMDKQMMVTQVATIQDFMKRLDEKIVYMARSCTEFCTDSITIPLGARIRAYPHDLTGANNNSIILELIVPQRMLRNSTIPINTNVLSEVASYGETNGIITVRETLEGDQYRLIFRLQYRELDTQKEPKRGYKIILEPANLAGQNKIVFSYGETKVQGLAANGGPLTTTRVDIETL